MSKLKELPLSALQFYATVPYACSYLDGRLARSQVATPAHLTNADVYSKLARVGFRRSGILIYRPHCDDCHTCTPCRVVVDQYSPSRAQRRATERYQALEALVVPLTYAKEHYQPYLLYQLVRHAGGGMDHNNHDQYEQFLLQSRVNSRLAELREPPESPSAGKLRMVSMTNVLEDGLSSACTFYDPTEQKMSYGTYNVLWQTAQVQGLDPSYVYLGYWIEQSRKIAYKAYFQSLELFVNGKWWRSKDVMPQAAE